MGALRDAMERDGFALVKGVFDRQWIEELETDFDRIVDQLMASGEDINAKWSGADKMGAADTVVIHTHNVQQFSAKWLRAMLHAPFLDAATEILGPNVVLHHSKLFQKPSEKGAPFPMHQDWDYFPTKLDTMIAGIIHVTKATDAMGCLRVVPGSHRLGRVANTSGNVDNEVLARYPLVDALPIEAEPGDVVFFHYFTIHGSMPNRTQEARKTVLVQLHAGEDEPEPGCAHPYERLTLAGWNACASRHKANESKRQ